MLPLVAAGVLYALVWGLLTATLPPFVPLGWDGDLLVTRLAPRGELLLLAGVAGAAVVAVSAGGAALVRRYAPTATQRQAVLRRLVSADLVHLGAVTLLFLAVELALVHGGHGGEIAVPATGSDGPSYPSLEAALQASRAAGDASGSRLPAAAPAVLVGYLAYLLAWGAWLGPRRYRRPALSTADSAG